MRSVDPKKYIPGQTVDRSLFHASGVKLVGAGTVLTAERVRQLSRLRSGQLFEGEMTARDRARSFAVRVADHAITATSTRQSDSTGPSVNTFSWDADVPNDREVVRARARKLKLAPQRIAERMHVWDKLPRRILPIETRVVRVAPARVRHERDAIEQRDDAIRRLSLLTDRVLVGQRISRGELESIVEEILLRFRESPTRFANFALARSERAEYLPEHSYTAACFAVAIAETLNWDEHSVIKVGMASLIADCGMCHVPAEIRGLTRPLDESEINRVWRHPSYSVVLTESIEGLQDEVARAVYEHHEREDGSGYPSAARGEKISDLAKAVSASDTLAAALSPRPYRPGKTSHEAISEIVRQAAHGRLGRVFVGGLVRAFGLYPMGSLLKLGDGRVARVVANNPESFARPVVRIEWATDDSRADVVDLSHPDERWCVIARVLPESAASAFAS